MGHLPGMVSVVRCRIKSQPLSWENIETPVRKRCGTAIIAVTQPAMSCKQLTLVYTDVYRININSSTPPANQVCDDHHLTINLRRQKNNNNQHQP